MQGFGIRTRSDIALGLLGVLSFESEIDYKKNLIYLGKFVEMIPIAGLLQSSISD